MHCNPFIADLRTKFICTIGRTGSDIETMEGLIRAGACMFRNNFAHAQYDEYRQRLKNLRELNAKLGSNIQMQADIQGTNIRVGELPDGQVTIEEDQEYTFVTTGGELLVGDIPINDKTLHQFVKIGEPIIFADGALEGEVTMVEGQRITVRVTNGGILRQKKSINVPATHIEGSSITEKDRRDLDFLINDAGVDWLALSFVGSAKDVEEVRAMIGDKPIRIISKIERRSAIDNLYEIIAASDAVMIARGDLGIEVPMEEVPIIGKEMITRAHLQEKPVITATQMLQSMTHSIRPTRAEVSDVANAIFDRSDAVMLSDETADGIHPVHALQTMVKIARRAEQYVHDRPNYFSKFSL